MNEGLDFLQKLTLWDGKTHFDLSVMRQLMQALGNPQDRCQVIHIAGTNGKGSTSVAIACAISHAGFKVALNISPHLSKVNERISISGEVISDEQLDYYALMVQKACQQAGISPSFHEALTAVAFLVGADCDYLVLEVGLGGRLDASNVIKSSISSVITSIGLDHQNILGDTKEKIAFEKAGIIKKGGKVYVGRVSASVRSIIEKQVETVGATAVAFEGSEFSYSSLDVDNFQLRIADSTTRFSCALSGMHQHNNMALAIIVARELGISDDTTARALQAVRWPGRLERILYEGRREVIFDGAHNEDGVKTLISFLDSSGIAKVDLVFGVLDTKPWRAMLSHLSRYINKLYLLTPSFKTAVSANLISDHLSGSGINIVDYGDNLSQLLTELRADCSELPCVVSGSLYMLGDVREAMVGPVVRFW